ncbi:hypothetical protein C1J02_16100 [Sulfitobacter sp. SK011]|nr:hypothetical protein C1J02_16100 [Sulfitobacter sp. SK011]
MLKISRQQIAAYVSVPISGGSSASDKCTNQNKYVLLCRSHPHRTFAAISRIAMAEFKSCGQGLWKCQSATDVDPLYARKIGPVFC